MLPQFQGQLGLLLLDFEKGHHNQNHVGCDSPTPTPLELNFVVVVFWMVGADYPAPELGRKIVRCSMGAGNPNFRSMIMSGGCAGCPWFVNAALNTDVPVSIDHARQIGEIKVGWL